MSACPKPSPPGDRTFWERLRVSFQGYKMVAIRLLLPSLSAMHRGLSCEERETDEAQTSTT